MQCGNNECCCHDKNVQVKRQFLFWTFNDPIIEPFSISSVRCTSAYSSLHHYLYTNFTKTSFLSFILYVLGNFLPFFFVSIFEWESDTVTLNIAYFFRTTNRVFVLWLSHVSRSEEKRNFSTVSFVSHLFSLAYFVTVLVPFLQHRQSSISTEQIQNKR